MLSISAAESIIYVLIVLIATCYFVSLCSANKTFPNPPYPNYLTIVYSPKQLDGLNSSPFEA
jgi:hypothetical protein